jgi:hypothetical protein
MQVCMKAGAKSVSEAAYFLGSGCEPLRTGLGITGLLLPQVLASHMVNALDNGSPAIDLGNEIVWDDHDADDRKLSAAAFMNHMSVMKVGAQLVLLRAGVRAGPLGSMYRQRGCGMHSASASTEAVRKGPRVTLDVLVWVVWRDGNGMGPRFAP